MRRLLLICLAVLLMLPVVTAAQDERETLWELSEIFTVSDLEIQFNYPAGWVWDASDGIRLAENEADLATMLDDDETTNPAGFSITLLAFPVEAAELEEPTLDNIVGFVIELGEISVIESVEVPVAARRSVTLIGTNVNNRPGIASVWIQDGIGVVMGLGMPDGSAAVTQEAGYSWGVIIGGIVPINTLDLGEERLESPALGFSIPVPDGWFTIADESGVRIYELESDLANDGGGAEPEGLAVGIIYGNLVDDLGLAEDTPLDELAARLGSALEFDGEPSDLGEFVVLGDPGIGIVGPTLSGHVAAAVVTLNPDDFTVRAYVVSAPDEEALLAFRNTFILMLQSIQPLEDSM